MGGGGGGDRSRDYHIDQLVGLETLQNGNEYIFVKGEGNDGHENVMLIASEANTSIFIDGNTTVYKTLTNAGDFLIIEGNEYTANLYVTSSSPVFAFQSTGRSNSANQGMIFVPPLNCSAKGDINNVGYVGYPERTTSSGPVVGSGLYSIVTQVGATLVKFNQYLITQSINIDLAPGAMLFPRVKMAEGSSQNLLWDIYYIVNYCKKPL